MSLGASRRTPLWRRPLTHWVADAALLSLLIVLANDAAFYLSHGDRRFDAWYERAFSPGSHMYLLPVLWVVLGLSARLRLPPPVPLIVALAIGWFLVPWLGPMELAR